MILFGLIINSWREASAVLPRMERVHTESKDGVPFSQTETGFVEFWGVYMNGRDLLLMTAHCCHM